MMEWKLWLDDERPAPDDNWVVAKNYYEAVEACFSRRSLPNHVGFDHDLGGGTVSFGADVHMEFDDPTGYDFALWMIGSDYIGPFRIPRDFTVSIQSANPVGASNIRQLWDNWFRRRDESDNIDYERG